MQPLVSTFSIAAFDVQEKAWGIGVASKFLAAGSVVPWARADAGAIATQALAKVGYGPDGLELLAKGSSAAATLEALIAADPGQADRQVGIVDAKGGVAAHTGSKCFDWAGHKLGDSFTCQGNILTGPEVLEAISGEFISQSGELADRLAAALLAGDRAGGDSRGKQSAAVLVVRPGVGYGAHSGRLLELRVDDHADPIPLLQQLVASHHIFFGSPSPSDVVPVDEDIARSLQEMLNDQGP